MPDIDFHSQYRATVDAVIIEVENEARWELRAKGLLFTVFMRPHVGGPDPDGRLTYFSTSHPVIDRLRQRGIPFDVR